MEEVTTKTDENNPPMDPLVEAGCRSKINPGTDDEMGITGYRLVRYISEKIETFRFLN